MSSKAQWSNEHMTHDNYCLVHRASERFADNVYKVFGIQQVFKTRHYYYYFYCVYLCMCVSVYVCI